MRDSEAGEQLGYLGDNFCESIKSSSLEREEIRRRGSLAMTVSWVPGSVGSSYAVRSIAWSPYLRFTTRCGGRVS